MNPLEQLKDIHLTEQTGQWPPAYGWWLLALLALILAALLVRISLKYYRARAAKRQALHSLDQLSEQPNWPAQINQLLKRLAISYYPQEQVASLYSHQWIEFLTAQLPKRKQAEFASHAKQQLLQRYQSGTDANFEQSKALAQQWIKQAIPPRQAMGRQSHV